MIFSGRISKAIVLSPAIIFIDEEHNYLPMNLLFIPKDCEGFDLQTVCTAHGKWPLFSVF